MNIWTTITILGALTIAGYYITAAYITTKTGTTNGIHHLAQGAPQKSSPHYSRRATTTSSPHRGPDTKVRAAPGNPPSTSSTHAVQGAVDAPALKILNDNAHRHGWAKTSEAGNDVKSPPNSADVT